MAKAGKEKRAASNDASGRAAAGQGGAMPRWARVLISLAVAWHLFAVFISPFSVPPSSQLVVDLAQSGLVRWYTDPLYLNHGYHFFGPEPPVNHLVRYELRDSGGAVVAEGEFPNSEQQWPRLFYHRHMMLADQAGLAPSDVSLDDAVRRSLTAYAHHLLRTHSAAEVRLDYLRHDLLLPMQSLDGADPNAPELFYREASVRQTVNDLPAPVDTPEPLPNDGGVR